MTALATIGHDLDEHWVPVEGKPYEASNLGNVRRIGGGPLRFRPHPHGYVKVSLGYKDDTYVHRIVCRAFHGDPPDPACHADHINGIRSDNRAVNLRWITPEYNRALRKIRKGDAHPRAKLTACTVREIRSHSARRGLDAELAERFGVGRKTICDIRLGKSWRHI